MTQTGQRIGIGVVILCAVSLTAGALMSIRSCKGDQVDVAERYTVESMERATTSTDAVFVIECRHQGRSLSATQIERISNALYEAGFELTRTSDSRAGAELVFFTRAAAPPKE